MSGRLRVLSIVSRSVGFWLNLMLFSHIHTGYTLASLYCDTKTKEAFTQLFIELFDTVKQVTGECLKLAPFYPNANCRAVIMDGEVPQAQGFAVFLAQYNNPEISGIWTQDRDKLLSRNLKTCTIHFEQYSVFPSLSLLYFSPSGNRHVDELPQHIPKATIARLKSIMGLNKQEEIDEWHAFCRVEGEKEEAIKSECTLYHIQK